MDHGINRPLRLLGAVLLGLALAAALIVSAGGSGRAAAAVSPAIVASGPETWRAGVVSEGSAAYDSVIGRLAGASAGFRSNRGVTDIYYIFPAPASARTVRSAALNIVDRTGAYTGTTSLTLEVRAFDGTLRRTASAAPLDLQTATVGQWAEVALATDPGSLAIAPGEYLAWHFALGGASAGDLDVRPVFEVVVE